MEPATHADEAPVLYLVAADRPEHAGWALYLCADSGLVREASPHQRVTDPDLLHKVRDVIPSRLWPMLPPADRRPADFARVFASLYPSGLPVRPVPGAWAAAARPMPAVLPARVKVDLGDKVARDDGSWSRPATLHFPGQLPITYRVGVDAGRLRRIPFKPRGTKGRQWQGWVQPPEGSTLWSDKVGGSIGAKGLLEDAAVLPADGCRLWVLMMPRGTPVGIVNAPTVWHALDAAQADQRAHGPLSAMAREDVDATRWHQLLKQWQRWR